MTREKLMEKYGEEKVLCIANRLIKDDIDDLIRLTALYGNLRYRYNAEIDYEIKQIIPYVVVKNKNRVLVTKRLKCDERLVGQHSIGTGGHINSYDIVMDKNLIDMGPTIENCIKREFSEETNIEEFRSKSLKFVKCFVDNSSDVSKVHACILFEYEITDEEYKRFEIREKEKLEGNFIDLYEFDDSVISTLEGWSKIAYEILKERLPKVSKSKKRRASEIDRKDMLEVWIKND